GNRSGGAFCVWAHHARSLIHRGELGVMEGVESIGSRVGSCGSRPIGEGVIVEICASAGRRSRVRVRGAQSKAKAGGASPSAGSGQAARATGAITGKRLGEMAEAAFVAKVAEWGSA